MHTLQGREFHCLKITFKHVFNKIIVLLTLKGRRMFLLKTASKQPLLKASWMVQN
jgi:hypothetical protein